MIRPRMSLFDNAERNDGVANFLFKTELIKTRPGTGKEFFFPVVHNLPGT